MANPERGPERQEYECPQCAGKGKDSKGNKCTVCNGRGIVTKRPSHW